VQRSKLVKDDKDRTKPQEIREQDIERAENETTKNVLQVRTAMLFSSIKCMIAFAQLRQLLEQYDYKMAPVDENDETIGPSEGGVNLFKFIVNPTDFGQSVENLFYLSFLIRDGNCAMEIRDGEPILCECPELSTYNAHAVIPDACEPADQGAYDAGAKKQQVVMELDMATWKVRQKLLHPGYRVESCCRGLLAGGMVEPASSSAFSNLPRFTSLTYNCTLIIHFLKAIAPLSIP
jgi:hypothetical protein